MASVKITELTSSGPLTGSEVLPIVQGSQTVKTTAQDIANLAGGGGSQTLAEVLLEGNETVGENIVINNEDAIQLENTSSLQKGTYDFGGNGGISRICSNNYEDMWQNGFRHVFDQSGFIRNSTNCFDIIPDETFDVTLRFRVDSLWTLDNGTTYRCLDATEGAAVWEVYSSPSKYKVYTALLTQFGGDDPISIDTGTLTIGVTYYINNNSSGMDFTNVGASNNNTGTYFVATGTTPNSWGSNEGTGNGTLVYNTGAPVVTVLENTIGNIWWTYEDLGVYSANALSAFTNNKTVVNISSTVKFGGNGDGGMPCSWVTADSTDSKILIQTQSANFNDILYNTPIEIRVYN